MTFSRSETNKAQWVKAVARHAGLPPRYIDADLETYLSAYWDGGFTSAATAKRLREYLGVKQ